MYSRSSPLFTWPNFRRMASCRVSNTPGNPCNLLEVYNLGKFCDLVCVFVVNISYTSSISECISTKYLSVNQDQLILRLVILVSVR